MKTLRHAMLLCAPVLAAAADWAPNLTTTAAWQSNATNADRPADIVGALQLAAGAGVSRRLALGTDDALFPGAAAAVEAWPRFPRLDSATLGPRLVWQHKFGLGALAPVVAAELAGDLVFADEHDRAGLAGRVKLVFRKRLDDATRLALTHEFARHDARGTVFDRTGRETALDIVRDLDERWSLAFAARWREGVVLSYATPPRPDLVALARVRTPSTTFGRPFVAYALEARTLTGALALTRALDETTALAFRYEWRRTERGPLRYVNHLVSATLARQF